MAHFSSDPVEDMGSILPTALVGDFEIVMSSYEVIVAARNGCTEGACKLSSMV